MGASELASFLLLATVVLASVISTLAQGSGSCKSPTGVRGRCVDIRQCPSAIRTFHRIRPPPCSIDTLICCLAAPGTSPGRILDISPPIVNFQCGQNVFQTFNLVTEPIGEVRSLRQGSTDGAGVETAVVARGATPPRRPGIPPVDESRTIVQHVALSNGTIVEITAEEAIGGVIALKNNWPWMALLGERSGDSNNWFCGGVLINDLWVLTALHCLTARTVEVVRLGEHDYSDNNDGAAHEDYGVDKTLLHPEYFHPQAYHDLALIKLDKRVRLKPTINPVCLPWGNESTQRLVDQTVILTGWGDTEFAGFPSSVLQEVQLTVFPPSQCDKSYSTLLEYSISWPQGVGEETVCAGDLNGGRDSCQGDSGGPIVARNKDNFYVLAGIVSRGVGCGQKDFPGLYVNVRLPAYLAWIKKIAFS
nr:venom protease-like [Procambarus clarkii]